jgi:hypothetical protein
VIQNETDRTKKKKLLNQMGKKVFNLFFIIATSFSIQTSTFFLLRERERERERKKIY